MRFCIQCFGCSEWPHECLPVCSHIHLANIWTPSGCINWTHFWFLKIIFMICVVAALLGRWEVKRKAWWKMKWFYQEKLLIVVPKPFPQGRFIAGSKFSCAKQEILFVFTCAGQCPMRLLITMWLSGPNETHETWLLRTVLHHQLWLPHFFLWMVNLAFRMALNEAGEAIGSVYGGGISQKGSVIYWHSSNKISSSYSNNNKNSNSNSNSNSSNRSSNHLLYISDTVFSTCLDYLV